MYVILIAKSLMKSENIGIVYLTQQNETIMRLYCNDTDYVCVQREGNSGIFIRQWWKHP